MGNGRKPIDYNLILSFRSSDEVVFGGKSIDDANDSQSAYEGLLMMKKEKEKKSNKLTTTTTNYYGTYYTL